ncbi:MAG: hypothetical protein IID46_04655 [Planctomycetes bacterium]|nr:hypothetical protein [Planctomycetota bacterium]
MRKSDPKQAGYDVQYIQEQRNIEEILNRNEGNNCTRLGAIYNPGQAWSSYHAAAGILSREYWITIPASGKRCLPVLACLQTLQLHPQIKRFY